MGNIHQSHVRENLEKGKPGQLADISPLVDEDSGPHADSAATEVWHVEVTAKPANTDFQFKVNGETVKVTSDGSVADLEEVATLLRDAANDDPIVRGLVTATISDVNTGSDGVKETVVLTANHQNVDIEVTSNDPNLTVSEGTDAGSSEDIKPGLAVFLQSDGDITLSNPSASDLDSLAGVSAFTYDQSQDTVGESDMSYNTPRPINYIRSGRVYVDNGNDASRGDDIWIGQDSDEEGEFFTADNTGNTRLKLASSKGQWYGPNIIELKLGL